MKSQIRSFLKLFIKLGNSAVFFLLPYFGLFSSNIRLVNLSYCNRTLVLSFSGPRIKRAFAKKIKRISGDISKLEKPCGEEIDVLASGSTVEIPLIDEPEACSYSLWVDVEHEKGRGSLELIRQSEAFLRRTFSFTKENGYCILGRRTIEPFSFDLRTRLMQAKSHFTSFLVNAKEFFKKTHIAPDTVATIKLIVQEIWLEGLRTGPCNASYAQFCNLDTNEQIRHLRNGLFSVQCSGVRDLFFRMARSEGLIVRKVEAFNYFPALPELIPYGHSLIEVYHPDLKRWLLVDPWYAVMFSNAQDSLLSCADLHEANYSDEDIVIAPLLFSTCRRVYEENGRIKEILFQPAVDLELRKYHFVLEDAAMLSIGYLRHFNILVYGETV